jgi:hypothetical protein
MKRILSGLVGVVLLVPCMALAQDAPAAKDAAAVAPAKPDVLPEAVVTADKPVPPPAAAQDPAAKPEPDDKFNAWFERFKQRYPKAAEHYQKLRQAVLDAKQKFEAAKQDKTLRREFNVARRNLHGFWVGFRRHQIKSARESIRRWTADMARHTKIMRNLAKQILK